MRHADREREAGRRQRPPPRTTRSGPSRYVARSPATSAPPAIAAPNAATAIGGRSAAGSEAVARVDRAPVRRRALADEAAKPIAPSSEHLRREQRWRPTGVVRVRRLGLARELPREQRRARSGQHDGDDREVRTWARARARPRQRRGRRRRTGRRDQTPWSPARIGRPYARWTAIPCALKPTSSKPPTAAEQRQRRDERTRTTTRPPARAARRRRAPSRRAPGRGCRTARRERRQACPGDGRERHPEEREPDLAVADPEPVLERRSRAEKLPQTDGVDGERRRDADPRAAQPQRYSRPGEALELVERVRRLDPAHGAGARAHDDRVGDRAVRRVADAAKQRAGRHAGRGDEDVLARDEVVGRAARGRGRSRRRPAPGAPRRCAARACPGSPPPTHFSAAAEITPSGVPPIPISMSTPVPRLRGRDRRRDVAVADQVHLARRPRAARRSGLVPVALEHDDRDLASAACPSPGDPLDVLASATR